MKDGRVGYVQMRWLVVRAAPLRGFLPVLSMVESLLHDGHPSVVFNDACSFEA